MRRRALLPLRLLYHQLVILRWKIAGPPRILRYGRELNAKILRAFGAEVGRREVAVQSPITLHEVGKDYRNLVIHDEVLLNGNNFLDLSERIVLEKGVSIGPGVVIMTHNWYNNNTFLVDTLPHTCGKKPVRIGEGTGVKAGALIVMGVIIGRNVVVAGNTVVNRDLPDNCFAAGVPARIVRTFSEPKTE
ncbi:MAG: acyltransferase [Candidatus Eisenbacteria bacterium]